MASRNIERICPVVFDGWEGAWLSWVSRCCCDYARASIRTPVTHSRNHFNIFKFQKLRLEFNAICIFAALPPTRNAHASTIRRLRGPASLDGGHPSPACLSVVRQLDCQRPGLVGPRLPAAHRLPELPARSLHQRPVSGSSRLDDVKRIRVRF